MEYKIQFGFEVEQAGPNSSSRKMQEFRRLTTRSGPLGEYQGHDDCDQWEIATYKPASYAITIKQLDMLYYSSLIVGQNGVKNYTPPFKWKNYNSGCHVHISLNFAGLKKILKGRSSLEVKRNAMKHYLRDYMNFYNFLVFFDIPIRSFMYFRDPVRGVRNNIYRPGVYGWANLAKPFNKDEFLEKCKTYGNNYHEYISPCPRWYNTSNIFSDIPDFASERFKLESGARSIVRIPMTIEFRANENFYFFAGELLRRVANLAKPFIEYCHIHNIWFNLRAGANFYGLWEKMQEFRSYHGYGETFVEAAKKTENIDIYKTTRSRRNLIPDSRLREILFTSENKIKFSKKYPSYAHFMVDFYRNLSLFGSKYREVPLLYMCQPSWKKEEHKMMWYFRKCLSRGMDIKSYLTQAASGGEFTFDGKTFMNPILRIKPARLKNYMKESRAMDKEYC